MHITHWKANTARVTRKQRRTPEERGLEVNDYNRPICERWRDRSVHEVLAWHRQVQAGLLTALRVAPDAWFSSKERACPGPLTSMGIPLRSGSTTSSGVMPAP